MLLFLLGQPVLSAAAVYQCTGEDGAVSFKNVPCESGQQRMVMGDSEELKTLASKSGIHVSWLRSPQRLRNRVSCNRNGCRCGDREHDYQENTTARLLNAMSGLQGRWRFYNRVFDRNAKQVEDAACAVAINQRTIREYYPTVAAQLISDYEQAVESVGRLNHRCIKPDIEGWTRDPAAFEYVRCLERHRGNTQYKEARRALRRIKPTYEEFLRLQKELAEHRIGGAK